VKSEGDAMQDKRRHKRFTWNVTEVNARMMFATEVEVIDISIGGILIKANRRLNIGHEYALKLDAKNKVIPVKGTVVWSSLDECRAGENEEVVPIYAAGMKFANMTAERIAELLNFIESNKKAEVHVIEGNRLSVRFHLDNMEKAVLNIPANYEIREVSLGGMLIECPQDFEIEGTIPMSLSLHDDKLVKFTGRVASCRVINCDGQKRYAIGIEFLDLTDKDREVLRTFIARYTFVEDSNTEEAYIDELYSTLISPQKRKEYDRISV
jgi:Tfp pilus assembly protein PilZ